MIRRMEAGDLKEIAALEQICFSVPWSESAFRRTIARPEYRYLVETENGRIVGYGGLLMIGEEGDIISIAVRPDSRNRRIGRRLLEELLQRGREEGVCAFTLEVRVSNAPAIHLYERVGFAAVGVRPGYDEKPREDALIMWKRPAGDGTITT